jgi:hypothetical protein
MIYDYMIGQPMHAAFMIKPCKLRFAQILFLWNEFLGLPYGKYFFLDTSICIRAHQDMRSSIKGDDGIIVSYCKVINNDIDW